MLCGDCIFIVCIDGISNGVVGIMICDGEGGVEGFVVMFVQLSLKMFMIVFRNVDVIYYGICYNEGG